MLKLCPEHGRRHAREDGKMFKGDVVAWCLGVCLRLEAVHGGQPRL